MDTAKKECTQHGLVVSCIDKRLTDDVINFVTGEFDMQDCFYQFMLAGCALGADVNHEWDKSLFDHIGIVLELLHGDKKKLDRIILIEHRDCGAYKKYLGKYGNFDQHNPAEQERELVTHTQYVLKLADKIELWCKSQQLHYMPVISCFLMGLDPKENPRQILR